MLESLGITWPLSTVSGYGIYGVEIAQSFFRLGGRKLALTKAPLALALPPPLESRLAPCFEVGKRFEAAIRADPRELLSFDFPVLHGVGNDFAGFPGQDQVRGAPNIGCAAIEHLFCSPHGREVAKSYDAFIAISEFNAAYLRALNIAPVHLCHQGIDADLFRPQAKRNLWPGRFAVFSGGKFEFRKGQDIVLAAFKRFAARYPEALLVCAWQSLNACDSAPFQTAGHIADTPPLRQGGLDIAGWLMKQGLRPEQFIALPFTHQLLMPALLRECDAALFPNRCEGGTNLVAMEAMACGVPSWVAANSGQLDLIHHCGAPSLSRQSSVAMPDDPRLTTAGWGESDIEEIDTCLQAAYDDPQSCRATMAEVSTHIRAWNWHAQNEKLFLAIQASPVRQEPLSGILSA